MAYHIDIALTEEQKKQIASIPPETWFTNFNFRNAMSPRHPNTYLDVNNDYKQQLAAPWIRAAVKGKRVLDLFSANGAFAIMAAEAGAREVLAIDYSPERTECAKTVAGFLNTSCKLSFVSGDVYALDSLVKEEFDITLCLGGLYHIADPALILRKINKATRDQLILQTTQVLPLPGNWGKFKVRRIDKTKEGMTSIRGGYGTWYYTRQCIRELLYHSGFKPEEEKFPPLLKLKRFPWYLANCSKERNT